jgi:hypothetical protein
VATTRLRKTTPLSSAISRVENEPLHSLDNVEIDYDRDLGRCTSPDTHE